MIKRLMYLTFLISLWLGGVSLKTVLKSSLITLFVTYVIVPLLYHYCRTVQRHLIFLPYVNYPRRVNFNKPENEGLPGTRNFYLDTQKKIKVGVWQILPESLINQCPSKDSETFTTWFEDNLSDGKPIFLYLHGNTSSRAVTHRVELYKLLRHLDFHVVTFDYRGYADSSTALLSEAGVVHDATVVYRHVRSLAPHSPLIVWGHSLGTGVSCHAVRRLCDEGLRPTALILESPFNNIRDEIKYHPLTSIFVKMPMFDWLFLSPLSSTGIDFRSDEHIGGVSAPVLILHAQDDLVVPFVLGRKLFETSKKVRQSSFPPVRFESFESGCGYGHKFICRAPHLPRILTEFVSGVCDWKVDFVS